MGLVVVDVVCFEMPSGMSCAQWWNAEKPDGV